MKTWIWVPLLVAYVAFVVWILRGIVAGCIWLMNRHDE